MLIFAILAIMALLFLGSIVLGSLLFGGLLMVGRRTRIFVPIFFLLIPATVLGALAGAVIIGYLAVRANESLVLFGPLGGLCLGGVAGLLIGAGGTILWWWRISRAARRLKAA